MEEKEMHKIINNLHADVNDVYNAWDAGKIQSIEAIRVIKNLALYLIGEFIRPR